MATGKAWARVLPAEGGYDQNLGFQEANFLEHSAAGPSQSLPSTLSVGWHAPSPPLQPIELSSPAKAQGQSCFLQEAFKGSARSLEFCLILPLG